MANLSLSGKSVVESFAASLGLNAKPAADGSYNFIFERLGVFSIMPTDGDRGTIVSLARNPRSNEAKYERKLLASGGVDRETNQLVYAAISEDGSHVFAVDFDDSRWNLPDLDGTLIRLGRLHDSLF